MSGRKHLDLAAESLAKEVRPPLRQQAGRRRLSRFREVLEAGDKAYAKRRAEQRGEEDRR